MVCDAGPAAEGNHWQPGHVNDRGEQRRKSCRRKGALQQFSGPQIPKMGIQQPHPFLVTQNSAILLSNVVVTHL